MHRTPEEISYWSTLADKQRREMAQGLPPSPPDDVPQRGDGSTLTVGQALALQENDFRQESLLTADTKAVIHSFEIGRRPIGDPLRAIGIGDRELIADLTRRIGAGELDSEQLMTVGITARNRARPYEPGRAPTRSPIYDSLMGLHRTSQSAVEQLEAVGGIVTGHDTDRVSSQIRPKLDIGVEYRVTTVGPKENPRRIKVEYVRDIPQVKPLPKLG